MSPEEYTASGLFWATASRQSSFSALLGSTVATCTCVSLFGLLAVRLGFWTPVSDCSEVFLLPEEFTKIGFFWGSTPGTLSSILDSLVEQSIQFVRQSLEAFVLHTFFPRALASSSHLRVYRVQGVQENRWLLGDDLQRVFLRAPCVRQSLVRCLHRLRSTRNGFLCHAHASVYAGLGNLTRFLRAGGLAPHGVHTWKS